jgi:hypothetical protein
MVSRIERNPRACQRAANRHAAHDAKAIARPGTGLALKSKSVGAFAAADGDRVSRQHGALWGADRSAVGAFRGAGDARFSAKATVRLTKAEPWCR